MSSEELQLSSKYVNLRSALEKADEQDRREFRELFTAYHVHSDNPRVKASSNERDYLDCEAVRKMVEDGWRFVPIVIACAKDGDPFLPTLLSEMTGVKLNLKKGELHTLGNQARLWLEWWEAEGNVEYARRMKQGQ